VRFRDLYVRIHSAGMISTLGIYSFILAALFLHYGMTWKVLVLGLLMFVVQPVTSQALAQAAYQANLKPLDAVRDDLKGKIEIHEDQIQDLHVRDE
jgi:monovalent cation/proton antiporter MnhG/PhaG subunit